MKNLMKKMMLSCKKATELIDKKIHIGITPNEKIKLHFHTMMCNACTNYEKQAHIMDKALKDKQSEQSDLAEPPAGLIDRVIFKLEENKNK
jgi:5,10-methylenetetrahydrofolate reductase